MLRKTLNKTITKTCKEKKTKYIMKEINNYKQ
jgi:hypothetical protein